MGSEMNLSIVLLTEPGLLFTLDFDGQAKVSQLDGRSFSFAGQ